MSKKLGIVVIILILILAGGTGLIMYSKTNNIQFFSNKNENEKTEQENSNEKSSEEKTDRLNSENSNKEAEEKNQKEEQETSLHSGSNFCKYGDNIVYCHQDNNSIYLFNVKEKTGKKLCTIEKGINRMYFDGENIYCVPYYYRGKGIYKVDLEGNVKKIYEGASLQLYLENDKIYFTKQIGFDDMNQNAQGNICVINKDGSEITEIAESVKNDFYIQGDYIYYTNQSRQMYKIKKDGTNQSLITEGRKFITTISDKYLVYLEYGNQEEKGIVNLETNEIKIVGTFGRVLECLDNRFLYIRKRALGTDLEDDYTLFKINEDTAEAEEINTLTGFSDSIYYVYKDYAYIQNQNDGMYKMNIYTKEKENPEILKNYNKFVGGYAYSLNNYSDEVQKVKMLDLDTLEETVIEEK